ncbi:MAG: hypothetical protein JSW24_03170 [Dehalococcoidia bacterium]|nr:MAG: hypothetical protein JSW24_03170 [Dehalococcoidia bacterium]
MVRPTRYVFCFVLLFAMLSGLLGGSVVLAAQEASNGSASLPPSQEEPPPEEPPETKFEAIPRYPVMRAFSGEIFEFEISLVYQGSEPRAFDLDLTVPVGWIGEIRPTYGEFMIESITLEPGKTYPDKVKVLIAPLAGELPEPGEYTATFNAGSGELKDSVELTAVVTEIPPTYNLYVSTATLRRNMEAKAGEDNHLTVIVENYGTGTIDNITFTSTKSEGWSVTFTPYKIDALEPGLQQEVDIVIAPPAKTIAGDYNVLLKFLGEKATYTLEMRVTVITPTIWGGAGIGIAVAVIAGLVVLFRRLGRR